MISKRNILDLELEVPWSHGCSKLQLMVYTGPNSQPITLDHGRKHLREAGLGVKTGHQHGQSYTPLSSGRCLLLDAYRKANLRARF